MTTESIAAGDGARIPLTWFAGAATRCVVVFLPALGVQSRMYHRLGVELSERGYTTCLMEQRGHGASSVKVRRGTRFGISEFIDHDIPAILDEVESRFPGVPVILGGHSLGGHLSTIYAGIGPERIAGVVHVACGFPYHADFPGSRGRMIRVLCHIIALAAFVPGYFPGKWVGFGGRESIGLMQDWRGWATTGRFDFGRREGVGEAVSMFTGPVLSVSMDKDDFSSPAAETRALSPFTRAAVTQVTLGEAEQGAFLGHFAWAREPAGVVNSLADWAEKKVLPGGKNGSDFV